MDDIQRPVMRRGLLSGVSASALIISNDELAATSALWAQSSAGDVMA
jgi:hypothetical protein